MLLDVSRAGVLVCSRPRFRSGRRYGCATDRGAGRDAGSMTGSGCRCRFGSRASPDGCSVLVGRRDYDERLGEAIAASGDVYQRCASDRPGYFAKGDFKIDLEQGAVTCPAGQTTRKWKLKRVRTGARGERVAVKQFEFAAERCRGCVHYRQCVSSKLGKGRSVVLHPEEGLLQEARAYQETEAFREDGKLRQVVEHRLARLVQLGIRQARYFGRVKTKWQLLLAAAVANLVLVAAWERANRATTGPGATSFGVSILPVLLLLIMIGIAGEVRRRQNVDTTALTPKRAVKKAAFRPGF